jgi:hypothetical protein
MSLQCNHCGDQFDSDNELFSHIITVHGKAEPPLSDASPTKASSSLTANPMNALMNGLFGQLLSGAMQVQQPVNAVLPDTTAAAVDAHKKPRGEMITVGVTVYASCACVHSVSSAVQRWSASWLI